MNYSNNGQIILRLALKNGLKTAGEFAKFLNLNK